MSDRPTTTAMERERAQSACLSCYNSVHGPTTFRACNQCQAIAQAIDKAVSEERERLEGESLTLRMVAIGTCSTLERAKTMGVPGAGHILGLLREALALRQPTEPRGDHG